MKVDIYVCEDARPLPRYGFLPPDRPTSLLPRSERWKYVRTGDTAEFHLPEVIDSEIERCGFWAHTFGAGAKSH